MNWLKWLWNVATRVVLPVVTAVQRVAQQREAASKPKPETMAVSAADGVSKPKPATAPSPQPPPIPQRRTVPPDLDIGPRIDPTPVPVMTPGEQRALQDLLDKPRNRALPLLVKPDAEIVLKIAHRIPGILETVVQLRGSFKAAFDYLLADGVSLEEEEIAALLEMSAADDAFLPYPSTLKPTPPEPLWGVPRVIVQPVGPPPPSRMTSPLQNSLAQVGPIPVACLGTGPAAPVCFLAVLGGAALVSGLANAIRYQTDSDYRRAMDNAAWELQQLLESPFRTPSASLFPQATPPFPDAVRLALAFHYEDYLTALRDFESNAYLYQDDNYEALIDEERARLSAVYVQQLWEDPVIGQFLQDEFERLGILAHDVTDWADDTVMMVKWDKRQVDSVASDTGITAAGLRRQFGEWLESQKERGNTGSRNTRGDFTYQELYDLAEQYAREHGIAQEDDAD